MKPGFFDDINDRENITDKLKTYIKYAQYGTQNSMFSIEASKLHDALMDSICLNHQNTSDRKTFVKILSYIKILFKRFKNVKILNEFCYWHIYVNDNVIACISNDCFDNIGDLYSMAIVFETDDTTFVKFGKYEEREGCSVDGECGIYFTEASITEKAKQHVYSMGLVPALVIDGSYHENFPRCVGILPEYVSQLKPFAKELGLYFNGQWKENKKEQI